MRHGVAGKKFGRNQKWREATLRDLAKAVLSKEKIVTTHTKASEARKLVDKLVTLGKKNTLAAKRRAFAILCDHVLVSSLFNVIAPRFSGRQGGYTRLIKFTTNRQGDNAQLSILELTEKAPEKTESKIEDATIIKAEDKQPAKVAKSLAVKKPAVKKPAIKKAASKKEAAK